MKIYFLPRQAGISDMLTQVKRFIAIGQRLDYEVGVLALPNGRVSTSCNLSSLLIGTDPSAHQNHGLPMISVTEFSRLIKGNKVCLSHNECVVRSDHARDVKALYKATGATITPSAIACMGSVMRRGRLYDLYAERARQKPPDDTLISLHMRLGDTAVVGPDSVAWNAALNNLFSGRFFFTYNSMFYSRDSLHRHLSSHSFLKRFIERPLCNDYLTALSSYLMNSGKRFLSCRAQTCCGYRVALNSDGFTLAVQRLLTVSQNVSNDGLPDANTLTRALNQHYLSDLMQYSDQSNIGETDQGLLESILSALLADVVFKGVSAFPLDIRDALMIPPPLVIDVKRQVSACRFDDSSHIM
jgi:hypothetical protein